MIEDGKTSSRSQTASSSTNTRWLSLLSIRGVGSVERFEALRRRPRSTRATLVLLPRDCYSKANGPPGLLTSIASAI